MLEEFLNNLMIEKIREYGKKKKFKDVIDIGGKDGKYVSKISKNLTIVDLNPQIISSKINYIKTDIKKFETDEKYDVVVSSAFLEHFSREEGLLVVRKINSLLKENGLVFITCPNAWSLNRLLGEIMGMGKALDLTEGDIKVGHKYLYNLSRLQNCVKSELVFIDSGSYFLKPLPATDMNQLFDKNAFKIFASINSHTHSHLKEYLAEIYVICKKLNY